MSDLQKFSRYAECKVCGTRYHLVPDFLSESGTNEIRCNGRKITRCIAAHKEADPPSVQNENMRRFMEGSDEVTVIRNDWYCPAGTVCEDVRKEGVAE